MKLVARWQDREKLEETLRRLGTSPDGWIEFFEDSVSGERWRRTFLGGAMQGGGLPVLVHEPVPDAEELLTLASTSNDLSEIAASAWMLAEIDADGRLGERLLSLAEVALKQGERARAVLMVRWSSLPAGENLRPAIGKRFSEVVHDHDHFKHLASRARAVLAAAGEQSVAAGWRVFGIE